MITKLATFKGTAPDGEPLVCLFEPQITMVKEAKHLMPPVQEWLNGYQKDPNKLAVLVNALGASEYYGANVNGDDFPEASLVHDCRLHSGQSHPIDDFTGKPIPPYGYWTFLNALPFKHHQNKDPNRAFGTVAVACWNAKMHRVELVVLIDKALALQNGAQDVVDRILAGEFPDVSMGTRIPYDVCSICGHKSKTREDYCSCVKNIGLGKILDDGRRISVINPHPRFFDISFVFIGADKTAKVMCKLASGSYVPQSVIDAETVYNLQEDRIGLIKAACGVGTCKECVSGCRIQVKTASIDPMDEADTRLIMGRTDNQESPTAIEDGVLRTNAGTLDEEESAGVDSSREQPIRDRRSQIMDFYLRRGRGENPKPPGSVCRRRETVDYYLRKAQGGTDPRAELSDSAFVKGGSYEVDRRDYHIEGNPDLLASLDRVLLATKRLGSYGSSRTVEFGVDGDGPDGLTALKGAKKEIDKEKFDKELDHETIHPNRMKTSSADLEETFKRAKNIKIGPPPKPNRKEFPFTGTIKLKGLTIHVENRPGDIREGKGWKTHMKLPYGEILGTRGVDGDKLDVYVGPWDPENVYIVHQNFINGRKAGKYDEDKVMLGFQTPEQAKAAYLAHYDNPKFFRSLTVMAYPLFKKAVVRKEAHGEKLASIWSDKVADLILEDEFSVASEEGGTMKVASANLDELFAGAGSARRREKTWRDSSSGKELNVIRSNSGDLVKAKTASVDIAAVKVARVIHHGWSPEELLKVSNETKMSHLKWAEIVKRIGPSKAVGRVSPILSQTEPSLPKDVLNQMGECPELEKSLATPALMGMALKPEEFQRIILVHIGKGDLADKLDNAGAVAAQNDSSEAPCAPLDSSQFDETLLERLLPFLEDKSYTGPVVRRRIGKIITSKPASHHSSSEVDSPLLSKIASAYTWYRKEIMKLASELPKAIVSHPELHARTLGLSTEDMFSKTASPLGLDRRTLTLVLGSVPLALLYSAHKRRSMARGEDVGLLGSLVAEHPWLTSMAAVSGLGALLRDPKTRGVVDRALDAGDKMWRGGQYVARGV